ncbi:MAG: hypothetical protein ACRDY2_04295 [Acidimicrobiales bacterium]
MSKPRSAHAADALVALVSRATRAAGPDIGRPDTGRPDTGRPDIGRPDTGCTDTGCTDTGCIDGADAGVFPPNQRLDPALCAKVNAQCPSQHKVRHEGVTCVGAGTDKLDDGHPDHGGEAGSGLPPRHR